MEQTGTNKAWMASAMTMIAVILSFFGVGEAPMPDTIKAALMDLIMIGASGVVSYGMTWYIANKKLPT